MALTEKRKQGLVQIDYTGFFKNSLGQTVFQGPAVLGYLGERVMVYKDPNDPKFFEKVEGMKTAIKTLQGKGFSIPPGTNVYCTSKLDALNQAFHFDGSFNLVCNIVLGPRACEPGDLASVSNSKHPGWTKIAITCIHEFGHALHVRALGGLEAFYDPDSPLQLSKKAANSAEVSGYAGNNKKEFVAEVFAGRMIGRKYSKKCMAEYATLGGPSSASFP